MSRSSWYDKIQKTCHIGQTPHGREFLLQGSLLLSLLADDIYRPTKDLDLLGRGDPSPERLKAIFQEACALDFPEDGMRFGEQLEIGFIKEGHEYPGMRLKIPAWLDIHVLL